MDGLKGEVKKSLNDVTPEEWDAMRAKYAKAALQERAEMWREEWAEEEDIRKVWEKEANKYLEYPSVNDPVESPVHYNTGSVECIEAIKASMSDTEFKGYLKGNAMKYLWRYAYKGKPEEDLKKAQWYLARLTEEAA